MSVLSDRWIKKMAEEKEMIKPFVSEQKKGQIISYGLSSFGYDARVSNEFKIFTDVDSAVVDPKNFNKNSFVSRKVEECIIPHLAYVDFPKQITKISFGILKYSIVLARANEFGGIIHSLFVLETKLFFLKFFGSTTAESTSVKILNSFETLAS